MRARSSLAFLARFSIAFVAFMASTACEKPQNFTTTVEVAHVQRFGSDPKAPSLIDLELLFPDCGADVQRLIRLDKKFAECVGPIKAGDKLTAQIALSWNREKGSYRSDFTKIGACEAKADQTDEANYELVQVCKDLVATGATVGTHCDRSRPKALLEKCPFLRRK